MSSPDPGPGSREHERGSFWTTLPGVLTGTAALITAIVGLISLFRGPSPDLNLPEGASSARVSDASSPQSGVPPPAEAGAVVLAQRRVVMKSGDSVDLETGITGNPDGLDLYLHCTGTQCILNAMQSLMAATEGTDSRESCIEALEMRQDQALDSTDLRAGLTLCVQTTDGHVGSLQLVDVPRPGSIDFVFTYTLWR